MVEAAKAFAKAVEAAKALAKAVEAAKAFAKAVEAAKALAKAVEAAKALAKAVEAASAAWGLEKDLEIARAVDFASLEATQARLGLHGSACDPLRPTIC
jgi:hypothetical protein